MKKKKKSGGLTAGIIAIIACIVGLFLLNGLSGSLLKTLLTVGIIAVIAVIVLSILIVMFARKASQESAAPQSVVKRSEPLTKEQEESLRGANSLLLSSRMTLSRIQDREISETGIRACSSIEKVLHTLKEKPEKIQTTRQLFNYYLPTMDKVLSKYQRIEESGVDNPEMPENLKKYLGDIDTAMDKLYDGLFDNDKLHVAVDMEAMTIAIKRDGLLDDEDFKDLTRGEAPGAASDPLKRASADAAKSAAVDAAKSAAAPAETKVPEPVQAQNAAPPAATQTQSAEAPASRTTPESTKAAGISASSFASAAATAPAPASQTAEAQATATQEN